MKNSTIVLIITAFYFGFMMGVIGFPFDTWQYWAITLPVSAGFIIYAKIKENND